MIFARANLAYIAAVVLATGCSTTGRQHGALLEVPNGAFSALCEAFQKEEGFDSAAVTVVLRRTRAIYETFALRTLHQVGSLDVSEAEQDAARDEVLRTNFLPKEVQLPSAGGLCRWELSDRAYGHFLGHGQLLLELSNPLDDPFVQGTKARTGVFARHSIGGEAATWYWIALERTGDEWKASGVFQLEISDG